MVYTLDPKIDCITFLLTLFLRVKIMRILVVLRIINSWAFVKSVMFTKTDQKLCSLLLGP